MELLRSAPEEFQDAWGTISLDKYPNKSMVMQVSNLAWMICVKPTREVHIHFYLNPEIPGGTKMMDLVITHKHRVKNLRRINRLFERGASPSLLVHPFVLRISCVCLNPLPLDGAELFPQFVESYPKFLILHGCTPRGFPPLLLPPVYPRGHTLHHV